MLINSSDEKILATLFADSFVTQGDDCAARGDWGDASEAYAKAGLANRSAGYAQRAIWADRMAHKCAIIGEIDSLTLRPIPDLPPVIHRTYDAPARVGARPIRVDITI